jgi:hypothetical protein
MSASGINENQKRVSMGKLNGGMTKRKGLPKKSIKNVSSCSLTRVQLSK